MENTMTERERQIQLQLLAAETTTKRNAIQRKKDELTKEKLIALEEATNNYLKAKREMIERVDYFRDKKHEFDFDDPRMHQSEDDARKEERRLSLLRTEHEYELHRINNYYHLQRIDLDNEERNLTECYENKKVEIMSKQ